MTSTRLKEDVELRRIHAADRSRDTKEELGQFLTPQSVATLVASLLRPEPYREHIRLLDPGAGIGSLSAAFIAWVVEQQPRPKSVHVVAVEVDATLLAPLHDSLIACRSAAESHGIQFTSDVQHNDFLRLCNDEAALFDAKGILRPFTHVIMNPPYHKISSDSEERLLLRQRGVEVSNIYAGFVALAVELLEDEGQLAAITPRSFCNGVYFQDFRRRFFAKMKLQGAHVLVSRQEAFASDKVLQENVIFAARKTTRQPQVVEISTSEGFSRAEHCVPYSSVLSPNDRDLVVHLPTDASGIRAMDVMAQLPATLENLGIAVSTGPVVDFRAKHYLLPEPRMGSVPLLYPAHFSLEGIEWPKRTKKPNALIDDPVIAPILIPRGNFVLVKRFSSKEEKKRIVARVLEDTRFPHDRIGLENHLNFFHAGEARGLDRDLSFGLAAFLNASIVDTYFRQFNGHTQVNASDLRMMRYPARSALQELGREVQKLGAAKYDQLQTDTLVEQSVLTQTT